jgi:pimeloyl-ACP methyl ester carboxylesterase
MEARGQGYSGKPTANTAYTSSLFADDVNAVITGLQLDHPVLAGWSMGGFIVDFFESTGSESGSGVLTPAENLICETIMLTTPRFVRANIPSSLSSDNLVFGTLLSSLGVPVLFQTGSNDPFFPERSVQQAADLVSNATVRFYSGGAHIPFVIQAEQFNQDLAAWLSGSGHQ